MEVIKDILDKPWENLSALNICGIKEICKFLSISTPFDIFSQMDLEIGDVSASDEWALNITKALGYSEYWNPPGGVEFFNRSKYEKAKINLKFQQINIKPYSQRRGPENIETGLSIIDVMMFNSQETIKEMLDDYELL